LIEGDYQSQDNEDHGDFELAVVRLPEPGAKDSSGVIELYWRENGPPFKWNGPFATGARSLRSIVNNPALIQAGYADDRGAQAFADRMHQNFYVAYMTVEGELGLWARYNDPTPPTTETLPDKSWHMLGFIDENKVPGDGICLMEGPWGSGYVDSHTLRGKQDSYVFSGELSALLCSEGTLLAYYAFPYPTSNIAFLKWIGPVTVGTGFRGRPCVIHGSFGYRYTHVINRDHFGHYEMVAARSDGGFAHFWKDVGDAYQTQTPGAHLPGETYQMGWNGPCLGGRGHYDEVSLIQSNFSASGDNGNLELVARRKGQQGFDVYFRPDNEGCTWYGPVQVGYAPRAVVVRMNAVFREEIIDTREVTFDWPGCNLKSAPDAYKQPRKFRGQKQILQQTYQIEAVIENFSPKTVVNWTLLGHPLQSGTGSVQTIGYRLEGLAVTLWNLPGDTAVAGELLVRLPDDTVPLPMPSFASVPVALEGTRTNWEPDYYEIVGGCRAAWETLLEHLQIVPQPIPHYDPGELMQISQKDLVELVGKILASQQGMSTPPQTVKFLSKSELVGLIQQLAVRYPHIVSAILDQQSVSRKKLTSSVGALRSDNG
jgi:hypothetical protein